MNKYNMRVQYGLKKFNFIHMKRACSVQNTKRHE
jgi:hypothetical protein